MTAEEAPTILQSVGLPSLNAEHPVTRRAIAGIPDDNVDYRPDDIVKSAIDLAWHIVTAEVRFMNAVIAGAFDLTPLPRPAAVRTAGDVNAWYDEKFDDAFQRLKTVSGDQLIKAVDFRGI